MGTVWQRKLRTAVLVTLACLVAILLAVRAGHVALPASALFVAVMAMLVSPTVFWWAWVDERLATRRRADLAAPSARQPILRIALASYTGLILLPVLMLLVVRQRYDSLPIPILMWVMAWHLSVAAAGAVGLVIWIAYLVVRKLRRLLTARARRAERIEQSDQPVMPTGAGTGLSRRSFLTGALAATPMIVSGSVVASGLRQQGRFITRRMDIRLPQLPHRLRGLTITHVSDFHVGRFFRPDHLPRVVDAVNRLGSDLIAITGDTVDHRADFFPPACEAFHQMQSRYGRYLVIGNHDLIDRSLNGYEYLRRQFGTRFLTDEQRILDIGGERIRIAGLGWSRYEQSRLGLPGHEDRVRTMMAGQDPDVFTLALAHHPHAFDALADAGADLTLAGHTHGGQIMVTPPGSPAQVGCGNLLFRYIYGVYKRGSAAMYVTSGVGNWFPVRINAPAEIVQIRLV